MERRISKALAGMAVAWLLCSPAALAHTDRAAGHTVSGEYVGQIEALGCPHDSDLVMVACAKRALQSQCEGFGLEGQRRRACTWMRQHGWKLRADVADCLRAERLHERLAAHVRAKANVVRMDTECGQARAEEIGACLRRCESVRGPGNPHVKATCARDCGVGGMGPNSGRPQRCDDRCLTLYPKNEGMQRVCIDACRKAEERERLH